MDKFIFSTIFSKITDIFILFCRIFPTLSYQTSQIPLVPKSETSILLDHSHDKLFLLQCYVIYDIFSENRN
jgi:hypothetical protein